MGQCLCLSVDQPYLRMRVRQCRQPKVGGRAASEPGGGGAGCLGTPACAGRGGRPGVLPASFWDPIHLPARCNLQVGANPNLKLKLKLQSLSLQQWHMCLVSVCCKHWDCILASMQLIAMDYQAGALPEQGALPGVYTRSCTLHLLALC